MTAAGARIEITDDLRAKVAALGPAGERWVEELPSLLAEVAGEWDLELGRPVGVGGSGYLVEVTAPDGRAAVLKLVMPDGLEGACFADELRAMELGGYVDILRADVDRRIVMTERLGRPLATLGWSVEEQIGVLARVLPRHWRTFPDNPGFVTGADKAPVLARFIAEVWEETGRPCAERTVADAVARCDARHRALRDRPSSQLVLVHGDGHPHNVLESGDGEFKLIDPEGLWSEPAHDLAIPLRGWNEEALATADPAATVRRWVDLLARATSVDAAATLDWTTIERMSTGLFLRQLGHEEEARSYLAVADLLASPR